MDMQQIVTNISEEITTNVMDAVSTKFEEKFELLTAKKGEKGR